MILWCSNCPKFVGESPPYDDLSVEFVYCPHCQENEANESFADSQKSMDLSNILYQLWEAGNSDDIRKGADLIDDSLKLGLRPVDIAMGLLTPMLYRIGAEWERGRLTVEQEHRFTAFVESLFAMMGRKFRLIEDQNFHERKTKILLFNAEGNQHDLGIRILELWFHFAGIPTKALIPTPPPEQMIQTIERIKPVFVGFSVSMEQQIPSLIQTIQKIRHRFDITQLQIMIGGYAVKQKRVPTIRGTLLIPDVRILEEVLIHFPARHFESPEP